MNQKGPENHSMDKKFIQTATNKTQSLKSESCPQCGELIQSTNLQFHRENECKSRQVPCEFCLESIPIAYHSLHSNSCPQNPKNKSQTPENIIIPCEFCGKGISHLIYQEHADECRRSHENSQRRSSFNPDYQSIDASPPGDIYENFIEGDHSDSSQFVTRGRIPGLGTSVEPTAQSYQSRNPDYGRHNSKDLQNSFSNQFTGRSPFGSYPNPFLNPNSDLIAQTNAASSLSNRPTISPSQRPSQQQSPRFPGGSMIIQTLRRQPDGRTVLERRTLPLSGRNDRNVGPLDALINMFNLSFNGLNVMSLEDLSEILSTGGSHERGLDRESLNSFAVVKYDQQKSEHLDSELKKCAICLSEFEDGEEIKFLLCTHRFHSNCIDPWLEKHSTCPICKKDFSQMEIPNS
jgi:E3 ubiquitin-protein ligase ATL6/9/15/31/42/55